MSQQQKAPALYESLWPAALRARLAGEAADGSGLAGEIATLRALLFAVAADRFIEYLAPHVRVDFALHGAGFAGERATCR